MHGIRARRVERGEVGCDEQQARVVGQLGGDALVFLFPLEEIALPGRGGDECWDENGFVLEERAVRD